MNKREADQLLKASKILGADMTIQGSIGDEYSVSFFHQSKLTYKKYVAARAFILSLEIENDRPLV
jgi:hypothetical protein